MAQEDYHDVYKLVMLGESGVGKTNIINNFVKGTPNNPPKGPTVGIEYSSKTITVDSTHTIKVQIWDTAGQEQYRSLTTNKQRDKQPTQEGPGSLRGVRHDQPQVLRGSGVLGPPAAGKGRGEREHHNGGEQGGQGQFSRDFKGVGRGLGVIPKANDIRSLNSIFLQLCDLIAHGKREEQRTFAPQPPPQSPAQGLSLQQPARSKCC